VLVEDEYDLMVAELPDQVTCFSTRAGDAVTVSAYALGASANPVVSRLTTRRAWPVERRRLCRYMRVPPESDESAAYTGCSR